MGITRSRLHFPSPALILSCLALFAALGGSTYAATSSGSSSIHFTNATLMNGWKKVGVHYAPAGYAKDSLGIVHLRGGIDGGTGGTVALVLPKGLRPSHSIFPVVAGGGITVGQLEIKPTGKVAPIGSGVSSFTSLDGVSFAAGE